MKRLVPGEGEVDVRLVEPAVHVRGAGLPGDLLTGGLGKLLCCGNCCPGEAVLRRLARLAALLGP